MTHLKALYANVIDATSKIDNGGSYPPVLEF